MTVLFTAIVIFDGWLDGSLTASVVDDAEVQGTILCILVAVLIVPAQFELERLVRTKNLRMFLPVAIVASFLFAASWYCLQFFSFSLGLYVLVLSTFSILALLLYQYVCCGTSSVVANCGANYFCIVYLGVFSAFVLAVRIDFGVWPLLMFVFVVKSADIGAYAGGTLFGRHKFSAGISPGKTWEGMLAAVLTAIIVAILFAAYCDIMAWWQAVLFGCCFAFIGQMGDLAESMIKRDAEQKDSANNVPGFGGILDIIDSPLVAAPFAYLFFMISAGDRILR
ncbi:MAG: phosphatidate cytidylyltransferase [Planctomycetota bacterium]